jgi:zinc transporter, ZIP family
LTTWILAGVWGLVAGSALLIGAAIGYLTDVQQRTVAGIMGFGSGVLISALAFNLMDEAYTRGGFWATATGFLGGAIVYTVVNLYLARHGAKHRKRSGNQQAEESKQHGGNGLAIAVGSLLDDIPESIVIGTSLLGGAAISYVTVVAIFLSDIPESLSSASGMTKAGRPAGYVFGVWGGITLVTALAAIAGYVIFAGLPKSVTAAATATAAGAILAMLVDTMIPEVFEETHSYAGIVTVVGFLVAFVLTRIGS